MEINRTAVLQQFKSYVDTFAGTDEGVELKYVHSLKVCTFCEDIAKSLGFSPADVDLAWLIGVLHDIGRFEQAKRFHTFVDYKSMDHAKFGVMYLFKEGHIRDFVQDNSEDEVIRAAIGNHNAFAIAPGLTPRQQLFARLIRDADKIDIFRVYVSYITLDTPVWRQRQQALRTEDVSPAVVQQARAHTLVRTQDKKNYIDFFVGMLCLYFDLNYPRSKEIVQEQGYFQKLVDFHSENPQTEAFLAELRSYLETER